MEVIRAWWNRHRSAVRDDGIRRLREEDELELDMDVPENEADKMSLDGRSADEDDSSSMNDDTDEEDWAALGPDALRKASLPTPGAPRMNYNAISIPGRGPTRSWSRRRPSPGTLSHLRRSARRPR